MEKEYKTFKFETKTFREDNEYFYFEGYLSTFGNVDHGDDVVEKGAFAESLKEHMPSLFWSHDADEPLGIYEDAFEDNYGLYVKGKMPKADTLVSGRIIPQMKIGSIRSMSVGFSVKDKQNDQVYDEKGIRHLKKVKLWEGSLVTIPMNEQARVTKNMESKKANLFDESLPIADRQRPWNRDSAVGRVREWAGIDDNSSLEDPDTQKKYAKAFLWYDKEDQDLLSSYRLPIADIINGELTVVPRAIFAVAGVLHGARGGIYLPSNDYPSVIRAVEKYYEKMGIESPFEESKSFRIDDLSMLDSRTMEKIFCSGARFSRKNAKILVSFVKTCLSEDGKDNDRCDADSIDDWNELLSEIKQINQTMETKNV